MMQGFFFRQRDFPPGEGTATITARARVEPLGFAPGQEASGTATVTAVARVEPVGAIPPVPNAPTNNSASVSPEGDPPHPIQQGWNHDLGGLNPNTVQFRMQEATNVGFTTGFEEKTQPVGLGAFTEWPNHQDGVTRYYRVRAENGSGESVWSNVDSVVHPNPAPGEVQNLAAAASSSSAILVTWDAPASGGPVDHYEIETLERGDERTATGTSKLVTGLDSAVAYATRVRAIGPTGLEGPWSSYEIAVTKHPAPGLTGCVNTPNPLKPGITEDRLLITDNATENTNIRVYRNGDPYTLIGGGTQGYTPAPQSGSWHVTATGGAVGHIFLGSGSRTIPESDDSPTRTMPFSSPCTPP